MTLPDDKHEALAEWWRTFDGPAYPTGEEVATALAPLLEDWFAEVKADALRAAAAGIESQSPEMSRGDAALYFRIANFLRVHADRLEGR